MSGKVTFYKSVRGFGHIAKGKPCQDYALSFNEDGCQVLVVCDGHGGSTYVRSDMGAKIAAINTMQILIDFAKSSPHDIFDGIAMAVTAMPQKNPFIDIDGNKVRYEELNETQQALARQAKEFVKATEEHKDIQEIIKGLIQTIVNNWREDIKSHVREHKLIKEEMVLLSDNDIRKAYGCTVLAFLMTKNYWLAFQIGDGKIVLCNEVGKWSEPVPEDCECFLNRTTSLCDRMPEKEFRYALSGKGDIPIGVFLCSDGVDGSFARTDDLYDFYAQVMDVMRDPTANISVELEEFLPKLSENGSQDDVSIAGVVDTEWLVANEDLWTILAQEKKLHQERVDRLSLIRTLESKMESISIRLNKNNERLHNKKSDFNKWCKSMEADRELKEQEMSKLQQDIDNLTEEYNKVEMELAEMQRELKEWTLMAKIDLGKIEEKKKKLCNGNLSINQEDTKDSTGEYERPSAESIWK